MLSLSSTAKLKINKALRAATLSPPPRTADYCSLCGAQFNKAESLRSSF